MSRVAKKPIVIPSNVTVTKKASVIEIKGPKGTLNYDAHQNVEVTLADSSENASEKTILIAPKDDSIDSNALAGTTRANLANIVTGVTAGYQRKLMLVGVGYRAQVQGRKIAFTLGYSHPVEFSLPEGISAETPSQTDIIISGCSRQQVGQVAAEIRSLRAPERYKGKGVRYADERIILKETKKK